MGVDQALAGNDTDLLRITEHQEQLASGVSTKSAQSQQLGEFQQ